MHLSTCASFSSILTVLRTDQSEADTYVSLSLHFQAQQSLGVQVQALIGGPLESPAALSCGESSTLSVLSIPVQYYESSL